jgi:hypothetical protein
LSLNLASHCFLPDFGLLCCPQPRPHFVGLWWLSIPHRTWAIFNSPKCKNSVTLITFKTFCNHHHYFQNVFINQKVGAIFPFVSAFGSLESVFYLGLMILLSQPPKSWDYRCALPCPATAWPILDVSCEQNYLSGSSHSALCFQGYIHALACVSALFLFVANIPLCGHTHCLAIHLCENLGCFHLL